MALDSIALIVKPSDQFTHAIPGQPAQYNYNYAWKGFKSGMPICSINEADWGDTLANIISVNMRCTFAIFKITANQLGIIGPAFEELNSGAAGTNTYRIRSKYCPIGNMASACGDESLVNAWLSGGTDVPVIDLTGISLAAFIALWRDPLERDLTDTFIPDQAAITSGTATVGAGKDYASLNLFGSDLGAMTGDLTGEVQTAISHNTRATFNVDKNGYTFKVTSNYDPLVDPTRDTNLLTWTSTNDGLKNQMDGAGIVFYDKLYLTRTQDADDDTNALLFAGNNDAAQTWKMNNMLIDNNGRATGSILYFDSSNITCQFLNWKIWDGKFKIESMASTANNIFEQIFSYNSPGDGMDFTGEDGTVRNCAVFDSVGDDFANVGGLTVFSKNAATDATGSEGGLDGLTAVDEVESLLDSLSSFLVQKSTGNLYKTGDTTLSHPDNNAGGEGNPRPDGNGDVSIGPNESLVIVRPLPQRVLTGPFSGSL